MGGGRPTLFLREKPWGRGCLHSGTYLYIPYIAVSPPGFPREVVESKPFLSFPPPHPPLFLALSLRSIVSAITRSETLATQDTFFKTHHCRKKPFKASLRIEWSRWIVLILTMESALRRAPPSNSTVVDSRVLILTSFLFFSETPYRAPAQFLEIESAELMIYLQVLLRNNGDGWL